jgi:hypothetical protein
MNKYKLSQKQKVCISIPIYKQIPDPVEESSLLQCLNILGNYPISFICPQHFDDSYYLPIFSHRASKFFRVDFSDFNFTSVDAYSALLLTNDFYQQYRDYEYLLIYQLDSWVFRDELAYWCAQGYDYVGAPWFEGYSDAGPNAKFISPSGNGGFSLRKTAAFLHVTSLKNFSDCTENEDVVIVEYFPKFMSNFKIAPVDVAMLFSLEAQPRRLFGLTGKLPFGCHAFEKYDFDFFKDHITLLSLPKYRREYMSKQIFTAQKKEMTSLGDLINMLDIGFEIDWQPHKKIESIWLENTPFAYWLIKILRPRLLVELGTYTGASLTAFCQAINFFGLETRCFGIDTFGGDAHAGSYGDEVYDELNNFCSAHYNAFCTLQRQTFDDARPYFESGEIDLLHMDGLHTYEAVKHDFEMWSDAVSDRGIVLFHATNIRRDNFGVYKLWAKLSALYPHFEFHHGAGLGVLGVGNDLPPPLKYLFSTDEGTAQKIRKVFSVRGLLIKDIFYSKLTLNSILASRSWKITEPLRKLNNNIHKMKKSISGMAKKKSAL